MRSIAIEGIDGSGKSTAVDNVAQALEAEGLKVKTFAPFRLVNQELGEDIFNYWSDPEKARLAIASLKRVLVDCETSAIEADADVVLYDRHWMTAFVEIGDKPDLVMLWGNSFVNTALLTVKPEVSLDRSKNDVTACWMTRDALAEYSTRYLSLARHYGSHVLGIYRTDEDITPQALTRSVLWDINIRR